MRPKRPHPTDALARRRALADAAAGVLGSLAAVLAFYPVDVWKTSLQAGASGGDVDGSSGVAKDEAAIANCDERGDSGQENNAHGRRTTSLSLQHILPSKLPPIAELFRGLPHKVAHTAVSSFAYFFAYSLVQTKYAAYRKSLLISRGSGSSGRRGSTETSTGTKLLLTAFAAVINTCITLPLDTISSRKQAGTSKSGKDRDASGDSLHSRGGKSKAKSMPSYEQLDLDVSQNHASGDDGSDEGFQSARCSFSEEYQSANSQEDAGGDDPGTSSAHKKVPAPKATSAAARRQLYIKSPEKYKFSFSTNLAQEAFATTSAAAATATYATHTVTNGDTGAIGERQRQLQSVLSLWNGLFPAVLLCTNPAIQYTMYDVLKGMLLQQRWTGKMDGADEGNATNVGSQPGKLSMGEAFVFGLISKFFATIVTYPLIRCKVLLMVSPPDAFEDNDSNSNRASGEVGEEGDDRTASMNDVRNKPQRWQLPRSSSGTTNKKPPRTLLPLLLHIFRSDGFRGIYKGCSLQLLHTVLKSALLMMVREKITLGSRRFFRVEDDAS